MVYLIWQQLTFIMQTIFVLIHNITTKIPGSFNLSYQYSSDQRFHMCTV